MDLVVNGVEHRLDLDPRTTLLDALREHLGLTGAKKGCDHGQCGACTVLLDGRRVNSCLVLAVASDGRRGDHGRGPRPADELHPVQQALPRRTTRFQCGYCTPGQICSAVGMLDEVARGWPSAVTTGDDGRLDDAEIRERMSGNLCRCGAYANIVAAIARGGRPMRTFEYARAPPTSPPPSPCWPAARGARSWAAAPTWST